MTKDSIRNIAVLFLANALNGSQLVIMFIIGGLAGKSLTPIDCLTTLPISCIILGSMLASRPLARILQNQGQRIGLWTGSFVALSGAIFSAFALFIGNFWMLNIGSFLFGAVMSAMALSRFVAIDFVREDEKAVAISLVMASGLVGAIFGPWLVKQTLDLFSISLLGPYLAVVALNFTGIVTLSMLENRPAPEKKTGPLQGRKTKELLKIPRIYISILIAMISYGGMNLIMTSTPLAVVGCGFSTYDASNIVSSHVLAMYIPSFFTGYLIAYFGIRRIMTVGLCAFGLSGTAALYGFDLWNFYIALILLGIGWNFCFISATTMLAESHRPEEKGRIQGINDTIVFGFTTLASLSSGSLMNCFSQNALSGWHAVNYALFGMLSLVVLLLIYLSFNTHRSRQKS